VGLFFAHEKSIAVDCEESSASTNKICVSVSHSETADPRRTTHSRRGRETVGKTERVKGDLLCRNTRRVVVEEKRETALGLRVFGANYMLYSPVTCHASMPQF
jgi:hypothetical protein